MCEEVTYLITNDCITVSVEGEIKVFYKDNIDFDTVLSCIKQQDFDSLKRILFERKTVIKDFVVKDDVVYVDNKSLPEVLSQRLVSLYNDGLPYQPLLNFWKKLQSNYSYRVITHLYETLEKHHHPLFEDGDFKAWKGVQSNYYDQYSGKILNTPGSTIEMSRNEVDDNCDMACSYGYHVGSYDYANNFGAKTVEVKVNPADVVAIPKDHSYQKMRVCKYKVLRECSQQDKSNIASC